MAIKLSAKRRAVNVAVAKEVLSLSRVFLDVEKGNYLSTSPRTDAEAQLLGLNDPKKIQKSARKFAKMCSVCARGAMALAHIHLYDGVADFPQNCEAASMSSALFGRVGKLVENAFEQDACMSEEANPLKARTAAEDFGCRYPDNRQRLRAIMRNIIKNDGVFLP